MSTLQEEFETAVDESNDPDARDRALEELEAANECDLLEDIVRAGDVEREYRERALSKLAHPQCVSTLESLVEADDLPEGLHEQASSLLDETESDSGAGP